MLIEMVACGMQHFCCVSNVMYGSKLFTWGDNGAGQLGRCTSGNSNLSLEMSQALYLLRRATVINSMMKCKCTPSIVGSYTQCVLVRSAMNGRTHIYSFGKPNDEDLPKEKRCLPHKVQGLEEPSEILLFARTRNHAADLKALRNLKCGIGKRVNLCQNIANVLSFGHVV